MFPVDGDSRELDQYGSFGIISFRNSRVFHRLEEEKLKLQELMVSYEYLTAVV
jgi:hypothetical protein